MLENFLFSASLFYRLRSNFVGGYAYSESICFNYFLVMSTIVLQVLHTLEKWMEGLDNGDVHVVN